MTRTYHQITARYNTFFNGRESFRAGVRKTEQQFIYDYTKILPVFIYTDPDIARSVTPDMDRAINKASKVIANKSITAKPKERGGFFGGRDEEFYQQNEYNRWVRESYLLAGKAHFYKHDYIPASQALLFIIREYNMHTIRHEAKIWLVRSFSERGRFNEARLLFDEMIYDPDFPSELDMELYSTIADYYLKQDQLEQAKVNLEKALEAGGDKNKRVRYTYILAQLYERTGNYTLASEYYSMVIRMNPPYEMVFNARVNQAGVFSAGKGETGRMVRDLERMLRDDKNRDYQNQIYYAMGNVYMRDDDEESAIRMYSKSARARGVNPSQEAISYLALADIYFAHPDYLSAQAYYDSAVMNMNPGFPNQQAITEKSNMLKELAGSIMLYELEDSLQILAAMSEAERNRKIDDIIARVREDEALVRQQEQLAQQAGQFQPARVSRAVRQQAERSGGGEWYFYNPSAVNFGKGEFESLWGERRLEDNWRRSDRQVISSDEFVMMDEEDEVIDEEGEEISDTRSRDYYLSNIPLTDQAMQASNQRLQEALLSMGMIYKDGFQDYERSIEAYEELIRRFPEGEYTLPAMYDLYTIHQLTNDSRRANFYKDLIVSGYSGTPYASILTNPNYLVEYEQHLQEVEQYYEETFELFREDNYDQVRNRAEYALATWPENPLIPRFEYLRTLSYGSIGNMPLFKDMLSDYISTYPESEMAENARQFVAYLEDDYPEIIHDMGVAVIQDIYEPDQKGAHYFVLIADNIQDLINRMIFNLVNFNVDHYARLNLSVSSEAFTTNYQLIRVDGLPDIPVALDYLKRFTASEEVFEEAGRDDFPVFIISPENYNLFMKDKNIASYQSFFEEEYLNR